MRAGKIAGQVGHASILAYRGMKAEDAEKWVMGGQKKIVLKVPNADMLCAYEVKAKENNVKSYRVEDMGLTQIEAGTWTCLAIGPDEDDKIDKVCGDLSLL
jgi:PTH2 family peptidyl-tRNA hydrolase